MQFVEITAHVIQLEATSHERHWPVDSYVEEGQAETQDVVYSSKGDTQAKQLDGILLQELQGLLQS